MENTPSFKIDLDVQDSNFKPLHVTKVKRAKSNKSVKLADFYPKFEIEFFDVAVACAEYIDKISDPEKRLKYHNDLNKIFVIRHKGSIMRLFRELTLSVSEKTNGT